MTPTHVAIIMDGNGRWAQQQGCERGASHKEGARAVRRTVRHARSLGLEYLTLFAFSSLNWGGQRRRLMISSISSSSFSSGNGKNFSTITSA